MRAFALVPLLTCLALAAAAQPAIQQSDTTHVDTTRPLFAPTPPQERYLDGLKTAGRGVAQLKDGINQVARAAGSHDTTKLHQAGHRLGGLCGAARGFLTNGRASMNANVFTDSTRKAARDLALRVDSLSTGTKTCEHAAARDPSKTTNDLLIHIRAYEEALANFRTDIGLPNRATVPPTAPTPAPPKKP